MPPQSRPAGAAPHALPVPLVANWPPLAGAAILSAGAIAAYGRTFSVPLLFDDVDAIANNPSIRHWSTAFSPPINTTAGGRPILNLSLAINYAISGTAVWSYHVVNLAIHILAGLTLFGILRRTLAPRARPAATPAAFSAALLWTLHPLQTESVTYVIQRAESLMGLFYLLTLVLLHPGRRRRRPRPEPLVRPLRLRLPSWHGHQGSDGFRPADRPALRPHVPRWEFPRGLAGGRWRVHAGLGATWLILPFLVLLDPRPGEAPPDLTAAFPGWSYAPTQFPAIVRYLKLSVWPHPLVFDYGTQWVTDFGAIVPPAVVDRLGLIAATVWACFSPGLGRKSLGFAGIWFFAILAPTSLIPRHRQTAAEHRMYLALIPVIVLVVVGIYRSLGRAALPSCLALAAGLFGITLARNEDYRSALALWTDTVAKLPGERLCAQQSWL